MYICKNCKNGVPEGNKFCGSCGTQVDTVDNLEEQRQEKKEPENIIIEDIDTMKEKGRTFNQKKKVGKKKVILRIAIVTVLALVFFIIKFTGKAGLNPFVETIHISDFINEPVFEGKDGEGVVDKDSLSLDKNLLQKKLDELLGEGNYVTANEISNNISFSTKPEKPLSNGDTVTVFVKITDKNLQNKLGIRFTRLDKKFEVADLKPLTKVDPFDGFVPEFSGISPQVSVTVSNSKLEGNNTFDQFLDSTSGYYDIYKDGKILEEGEDLKIGDTVTFKFNQRGIDKLHENAYKPKELEKEYTITVADVPSYITSKDELEDKLLSEIKTHAEAVLKAYLASNKISDRPNYEGMYFLTPKANGWQQRDNWNNYRIPQMQLVYSYQYKDIRDNLITKYASVQVSNFINAKVDLAEGETLDENRKPEQIIDYENIKRFEKYNDFETLKDLFLEVVESNIEYYSYEMTEGMKSFE